MEDIVTLSKRMKKLLRSVKCKSSRLLSRNRSASTSNLSSINGTLHAQEQSQQSLEVQQDTHNSECFVCLANEEKPEVSVVNSIPLKSCDVPVTDVIPSIQSEANTCTDLVASPNSSHDTPIVDDGSTATNADTMVCLYEQPPLELVQLDDVPMDQLDIIRNEALQEANREYPVKCYDFCLICCDEDYDIAENVREKLCSSFNLVGCMIENDSFMLGRDIFQAYEFMMDRSTKVLFLITDAFNRNPFNQRLQNGAVFQTLMSRVKKEKCVPIFPHGLCEVPLPLSGIAGISCKLPAQVLRARVYATYTEEVRRIRVMKEQVLLEMRNRFYNEVLARKAEEHRANIIQQQQRSALGSNGMSQPGQSGAVEGVKAIPGLNGILENAGLGADQKSSVMSLLSRGTNHGQPSISVRGSEQVRIGDDVNIVVYVTKDGVTVDNSQQRPSMSSDSDSSQSSSSDSEAD